MCGIAGGFGNPVHENVETILATLAHRGPDGRGQIDLSNASLGHTRLAILDVEGGHQPMHSGDTWISFNGEIYNYLGLRRRYLPEHTLRTHSDTEVILHLYRKLGPAFIELLEGMFALAIHQEGELFLARDPLGIKPLYYGNKQGVFYFASEIKALSRATDEVCEFPPGSWYHSRLGWHRYAEISQFPKPFEGKEENPSMQFGACWIRR